jgi:hypothetical protein
MYDPFAGTGSLLYAAAHWGSYVFGSDIDGRQMRGKSQSCRISFGYLLTFSTRERCSSRNVARGRAVWCQGQILGPVHIRRYAKPST